VRVSFIDSGHRLSIRGHDCAAEAGALGDGRLLLRLDGRAFKARAVRAGRDWHVFCEGAYRRLALKEALAGVDLDAGGGSLAAPMPGRVIKLMVSAGAKVTKGQPLLILEAMKMEHTITAPADGVVKEIHYAAGEQVLEAAVLITLE
jgi:3-methylcrotonyl-CoA carboxylase alpha subunit